MAAITLGEWTRHALNIPELAAYDVKHYRLDVDDGYLEVLVGREPIGKDGELRVMPMNLVPFIAEGNMIAAEEPEPASTPGDGDDADEDKPNDWEAEEPGEADAEDADDGKSIIDLSSAHVRTMMGVGTGGNGEGRS
ncbi:hypothetical protein LCGC14_1152240 [marine sediment metagenome]|uniref:Uncharacterized protein n=1 Tax=marine sediment metagenome TaxID=412755 RepID=A0A0F9MIC7_9ZZZZ